MAIVIPQEDPQTVNPPRLQVHGDETTFGGGPGVEAQNAQVQQIAQHTNEIATFEKIRADQTAVQGVVAKSSELKNHLMTDPTDGLPAYKGINAMTGHDKVMATWQDQTNEMVKNLQPDQQGAATRIILDQGTALNRHAMGYVQDQARSIRYEYVQCGYEKYNSECFASMYGDPQSVQTDKANFDKLVSARAMRQGMNPKDPNDEQFTDFKRTYDSLFHSGVLGNMVNDPNFQKQAEQYYAANKDQMTIDDQEKAQKWLGDGSVKSQSNQAVADLMQKHPNSESGFLAAADKIDDPDVRSMVRQIGSAQFAQNRADQEKRPGPDIYKCSGSNHKSGTD